MTQRRWSDLTEAEKHRFQVREYREELTAALGEGTPPDRAMFPLIRDVKKLREQRDALAARVAELEAETVQGKASGP